MPKMSYTVQSEPISQSALMSANDWRESDKMPTLAACEQLRAGDRVLFGYRDGGDICVTMAIIVERIRRPSIHYLAHIGGHEKLPIRLTPYNIGSIAWKDAGQLS